jgi:hypothetical protein
VLDASYCQPGVDGAHEKGGVEGEGGRFRRNHCVPMPTVDSIAQLNELLAAADAKDDYRRIGYRTPRLPTIRSRFGEIVAAAEREHLSYLGFLAELVMAGCDDRDTRRAVQWMNAAGFPRDKRVAAGPSCCFRFSPSGRRSQPLRSRPTSGSPAGPKTFTDLRLCAVQRGWDLMGTDQFVYLDIWSDLSTPTQIAASPTWFRSRRRREH